MELESCNATAMEKDFDAFWNWVNKRRQDRRIPSIRQLEQAAGLSNGTLHAQWGSDTPPTVKVAEGLCKALGVSWLELWTRLGYIPEPPDATPDPVLRDIWRILCDLPDAERRVVARMLRGLEGGG